MAESAHFGTVSGSAAGSAPAGTFADATLGVYLSVPFCRAKCSFCNFASGVGSPDAVARYVAVLTDEIHAARAAAAAAGAVMPSQVGSVYFGGGTPSLLEPAQLHTIFAALRAEFTLLPAAEVTIEAAPGQIADDLLEAAMACGVNRMSLGVQSFVDAESRAVGRSHTGAGCMAEIARLRDTGIREVGLDLIAGLPHQTAASWRESLEAAAGSEATHLSVYMLEVDEGSRLGREVLAAGVRFHAHAVPVADASAEMYEMAVEWLGAADFAQYEISNFARRDVGRAAKTHRSAHNVRYWTRAPYVGFGVDAHSMLHAGAAQQDVRALRWANADALGVYRGAATPREWTHVDADAAFEEALFLGLRMNDGVSVDRLQAEFGERRMAQVRPEVAVMVAGGVMCDDGPRWTLSPRGRAVSNEVFERLLLT